MGHRLLSVLYWCAQMFVHTIVLLLLEYSYTFTIVYANEMPLFICNIEFYI